MIKAALLLPVMGGCAAFLQRLQIQTARWMALPSAEQCRGYIPLQLHVAGCTRGQAHRQRRHGLLGCAGKQIAVTHKSAARHLLTCFLAASVGLFGPSLDITSLPHRLTLSLQSAWAEQLPEAEYTKLAEVRGLMQSKKYAAADSILTRSLELWQQSDQPTAEIAAILKDRGSARQLINPSAALADLNAALKLYAELSPEERPLDQVVGANFLRGQVHQRLSQLEAAEQDFSAALDLDDENPFLWSARGEVRQRRADWSGATQDYLMAETKFKLIGDKIQRTLSAADASIGLFGSGDTAAALKKTEQVGGVDSEPQTLNLKLYTLHAHPTPYTPHPTPSPW